MDEERAKDIVRDMKRNAHELSYYSRKLVSNGYTVDIDILTETFIDGSEIPHVSVTVKKVVSL